LILWGISWFIKEMSALMDMVLGKRLTPEEQVKKWKQSLRQQTRNLDRSLRGIETEELKAKKLLQQASKRNDIKSCRILAREIVNSKKAKERIITSKAQLNSLAMSMQQQLSVAKVTGAMSKSTDVMKALNTLIKLPEISLTMQEMSKEMMRAGLIDEMISDALEMDDEELEDEAEKEVESVLFEITNGFCN
jgi:charged multivesicular body protein 3